MATARRPGGLPASMGPYLDPISDGDESEATVVAGHRPPGPAFPIDPLGDDARPIRSSPSPSLSASSSAPSVLDDEEPTAGTGRRFILPVLLGLGALVVTTLVILGLGLYVMRPTIEEVEVPAPTTIAPPVDVPLVPAAVDPARVDPAPVAPAAVDPTPVAPAPVAPPPVEAPPVAPAPTAPPTPTTAPAPATAPAVTHEPTTRAARSPSSTNGSTSKPPAEPEDDTPVRISSRPPEPTPEPTPTPTPVTPPAAAATASEAPAYFRVEFQVGDPSITGLEVKCAQGTGAGLSVVLDQVPKGNCRVTGRGGDAPLITMVTVVADRSYTCFGGRAPSCK